MIKLHHPFYSHGKQTLKTLSEHQSLSNVRQPGDSSVRCVFRCLIKFDVVVRRPLLFSYCRRSFFLGPGVELLQPKGYDKCCCSLQSSVAACTRMIIREGMTFSSSDFVNATKGKIEIAHDSQISESEMSLSSYDSLCLRLRIHSDRMRRCCGASQGCVTVCRGCWGCVYLC